MLLSRTIVGATLDEAELQQLRHDVASAEYKIVQQGSTAFETTKGIQMRRMTGYYSFQIIHYQRRKGFRISSDNHHKWNNNKSDKDAPTSQEKESLVWRTTHGNQDGRNDSRKATTTPANTARSRGIGTRGTGCSSRNFCKSNCIADRCRGFRS